jgi:asparagine synthase (glutamine-hydrolysing)
MGITNKPRQFLGYWGCDSRHKLEPLLAKSISQSVREIPVQKVEDSSSFSTAGGPNHPIWNVASTEIDGAPDLPTKKGEGTLQIAALSASGLCTYPSTNGLLLPDAWVNVRENCLILGREPFGRVTLYWTSNRAEYLVCIEFATAFKYLSTARGKHSRFVRL